MGWEPLADSDPVPGDPDAVRASARRLERLGDELGDQAGAVKRIDPGPLWLGLAAERFADHRDEVPPALESAAERCYRSASALVAYAGELDDAQDQAAQALRQARHASGHIDDAHDGLAARARHDVEEAEDAGHWNAANPDRVPREPAPWSGPDWASALADAEAELEEARRLLEDAVDMRDQAARVAAGELAEARSDALADPWISGVGGWLGRIAGGMLGGLRAPGGQELRFVVTGAGLVLDSKESWQFEALRLAGIDPESWDPALGLAAIDAQVRAGWEYYAQLYASDPERFLWAGMAKLAGASVYAGLQDLHVLRRAIEAGSLSAEELAEALRRLGLPFDDIAELTNQDLTAVAEELRFVETRLLEMQRKIFEDLAWQHVAYRQGGLAAMEGLYQRDEILDEHIEAWRDIDSGDPDLIERGTLGIVSHEQDRIIADDYDDIRNHSPLSWSLTMAMSYVAESPIHRGDPFREEVPYEVRTPVLDTPDRVPLVPSWMPGDPVYLNTPDRIGGTIDELAINNVTIREYRWQWIIEDMFPKYMELVNAGQAGGHIATPLEELAAQRRNIPDWLLDYEAGG